MEGHRPLVPELLETPPVVSLSLKSPSRHSFIQFILSLTRSLIAQHVFERLLGGSPRPQDPAESSQSPAPPCGGFFLRVPSHLHPIIRLSCSTPPPTPLPRHTHFYPAPAAHWAQALVRNWSLRDVADVMVPPHLCPSCPWLRCLLPPILLTRRPALLSQGAPLCMQTSACASCQPPPFVLP